MSHCCKRPEVLGLSAELFRWPPGTVVTWYLYHETVPPGLIAADVEAAIDAATAQWSAACGVLLRPAFRPEDARLLIYFGGTDGQWGILGLTELPTGQGTRSPLRMELDASEAWTPELLAQVVLHELGHGIGIGHSPDGEVAVMAAVLDLGLAGKGLQPWDKGEGVGRYGPPPVPEPGSGTPPADVPHWLKPFDFQFTIVEPGRYELVGQVDTLSGTIVNPVLSRKG